MKMRKTLSEDSSDVENLFHDCANNNFKNESKVDEDGGSVTIIGREGSSAHTTDGGDSGNIILVGGEAKSESAKDNGGSITVPGRKSLAGCGGSLEIILGQSATTFSGDICELRSVEISMSDSATRQLPSCKCAMRTVDKTLMTIDHNFICITVGDERIKPDNEVEQFNNNNSICFICNTEGGELVCCDNCSNACHEVCLG